MALTEDQLAQAERLHNGIAWVYPSTDDVGFWDRYFNQTVPELTPQEQASGITLGGYGPGEQQAAYQREQASLAQRPAPAPPPAPLVLPQANPPGILDSSPPPPAPSAPPQWGTGGDGIYASSLIQALRAATPAGPGNPGVTMMPNAAPAPGAGMASTLPTGGLINNPPVLKLEALPAQGAYSEADVRDLLSQAYDDWAAQSLPQQPAYDPSVYGGLVGGGN